MYSVLLTWHYILGLFYWPMWSCMYKHGKTQGINTCLFGDWENTAERSILHQRCTVEISEGQRHTYTYTGTCRQKFLDFPWLLLHPVITNHNAVQPDSTRVEAFIRLLLTPIDKEKPIQTICCNRLVKPVHQAPSEAAKKTISGFVSQTTCFILFKPVVSLPGKRNLTLVNKRCKETL